MSERAPRNEEEEYDAADSRRSWLKTILGAAGVGAAAYAVKKGVDSGFIKGSEGPDGTQDQTQKKAVEGMKNRDEQIETAKQTGIYTDEVNTAVQGVENAEEQEEK